MTTTVHETETDLVVTSTDAVADGVVELTLTDPTGRVLPSWTPGAHIDLILTPQITRQYSLCGSPADVDTYRIAVLQAPDSRGGSAHVHTLQHGATVRVRGPRNHFALVGADKYLFIAGGIGITPILSMIAHAEAAGVDWTLLYGGRQRASMAYCKELADYGDRVQLVPQDELGHPDLAGYLAEPTNDTLVYCCGPEPLLAAVEQHCASWPAGALHLERFTAKAQDPSTDAEFEVELAQSGLTLNVPADKTIFDVVADAGISVLGSCFEGVCGTCETNVLQGDVDHRDSILSQDERDSNEYMMICVSRSASAKLTLDL